MRINPEYEIAWEKLKLPGEDEEEFEDEEEVGYRDNDDEPQMQLSQIFTQQSQNPFFQLKTYNFWTGHTNFKISRRITLIINSVLGVESLEIVSPYRFHISIGNRFVPNEVKHEVQSQVIEYLENHEKKLRHE